MTQDSQIYSVWSDSLEIAEFKLKIINFAVHELSDELLAFDAVSPGKSGIATSPLIGREVDHIVEDRLGDLEAILNHWKTQ